MICNSCKSGDHSLCPNAKQDLSFGAKRPPTGLNDELDRIQRSGLCPCQHRVKPLSVVGSDAAPVVE